MLLKVKLLINDNFAKFYKSFISYIQKQPFNKRKLLYLRATVFDNIFHRQLFHKQQALERITSTTANQLKSSKTTRNHPKLFSTSRKLSETTQNYLKPNQNFQKLAITSPTPPESLPSAQGTSRFYAVRFKNKFLVRKVKIGKHEKNTSNAHASQIVNPFSQLWKVALQKVYKLRLNKMA